MNAVWIDTLNALGARRDVEAGPADFDFGAPDQELAAVGQTPIATLLPGMALIRVAGDDAQSFLHNQFTSDINHLAPGYVQHSAWCTAKGRMLVSMVVVNTGSGFLLRLSADLADAIAKRLRMFVLRSKVSIERLDDAFGVAAVGGSGAGEAMTKSGLVTPDADLASLDYAGGWIVRLDAQRIEWILPYPALQSAFACLADSARPVGSNAWRALEVGTGQASVTAATSEEFVPQMIAFERTGGVSFHKGCYPGQEIIARTQYLGKVKRHVFRARGDTSLVPGAHIYSPANPDSACGTVANTAIGRGGEVDALVVVQENFADGPLHVGAINGPVLTLVAPLAAD